MRLYSADGSVRGPEEGSTRRTPARGGDHQRMPVRQSSPHHAIALVPAALLLVATSAPWGGAATPTTEPASDSVPLPDPTVPTEALEAPASRPRLGVVAPRTGHGLDRAVATASTTGIPAAALSAYQRAETVINSADRSCRLSWQLIAAIGRVESDHGRVNGNSLDGTGVATPGIFGIPLDGSNNTAAIADTDAGQYDGDDRWDRAVGPMQFIPSTWSVVGVDGDADGKRDPQDVDDAALATAVYLCSGNDDLSTERGLRPAVFRYNRSDSYVDLVLAFMDAYLEGDFTSVPEVSASYAATFVPSRTPVSPLPGVASRRAELARFARDFDAVIGGGDDTRGGAPGTSKTPLDSEVVPGPGGAEPEPQPAPSEPAPSEPAPAEPAPVEEALTEEQATAECLVVVGATAADLPDLEALGLLAGFTTCMADRGFPQ